ncbi:MAG: lysophospholipid acyltransferase family protein [bacterium]|nr:lysophospholipid acyltransferase family protein [bacterium]
MDKKINLYLIIIYLVQGFFRFLMKLILTFFMRVQVETKENLKKLKGPLIIAANHASWTDPFLIATALPFNAKIFPIRYACLNKIFYFPLTLPLVWLLGSFPIRRGVGLEKSLKYSIRTLNNKGVIGIFPEGRRQRITDNELSRPKRGVAYLALKTKTKILPIKIEGQAGMRFSKFFLRKYKIKIKIGKVFSLPNQRIISPESCNKPAAYVMEKIRRL